MRCFIGVNKYAPVVGLKGDMGWIPPETRHKLEMQWMIQDCQN